MKRTTFRTKANAKKHRGAGRRVYKTKAGWKVSPECPRKDAKRRALLKDRIKTSMKRVAERQRGVDVPKIVWVDDVAPF
jgi:hypothetical protein